MAEVLLGYPLPVYDIVTDRISSMKQASAHCRTDGYTNGQTYILN